MKNGKHEPSTIPVRLCPRTTFTFDPERDTLTLLIDCSDDPNGQEHAVHDLVIEFDRNTSLSRESLDALAAFLQSAIEIRSLDDVAEGESLVLLEDVLLLEPYGPCNNLPVKYLRGQVVESRTLIGLLIDRGAKLARESAITDAELAQRDIVQRALARGDAQVRLAKKWLGSK